MKKALSTILAAAMISPMPVIHAQTTDDLLMMYIDSYAAYKNGEYQSIDENNLQVSPIISDDRTLVPARFVSEAFDCNVDWNADTKTVTITNDSHTIKTQLDSRSIVIDGKTETLDVPPQLINDRTMLPLRALAEGLGETVDYYKGLIVIGSESAVKSAKNEDLDNIIWDKFKCNMRLKKDLTNYNTVYKFSDVVEYGDGAMVTHNATTNGVIYWRRGNISYTTIPVNENYDWVYDFTIYNNRIYYSYGDVGSSWDWPCSIYSCNMNGGDVQLLADDAACGSGYIVNDKLYYASYYDCNLDWYIENYGEGDGDINVIDLNTGEKSRVIKGKDRDADVGYIISKLYDDILIYHSSNYNKGGYYWFDTITGESGSIGESEIHYWCNAANDVYFYRSDDYTEIKMYNSKTGEESVLATGDNLGIVNMTDKYIYYTDYVSVNSRGINGYRKIYRIDRPDI